MQSGIYSTEEPRQISWLTPKQREYLLNKSLEDNLRPEYRLRIRIMLLADDGESQAQICQALGCSRDAARYWSAMVTAGEAHRWQEKLRGRPKSVNEQYLNRLKELVNQSPREYGYSFPNWTAQWLRKHLAKELGIKVSDSCVHKLLKQLGLSSKKSV